jgi:hypothetical protein
MYHVNLVQELKANTVTRNQLISTTKYFSKSQREEDKKVSATVSRCRRAGRRRRSRRQRLTKCTDRAGQVLCQLSSLRVMDVVIT